MNDIDRIRRALELVKELREHVDVIPNMIATYWDLADVEDELLGELRKAEVRKCKAAGWSPRR